MNIWLIVAAIISMALSNTAIAGEIRLLASGATQEVVEELVPRFEAASGHRVVATFTGSAAIEKKIAAGELYDLVILSGPSIDKFIRLGTFMAGSRTDLMKSAIGVAIKANTQRPDLGSSDGLKAALLAAKSIGLSTGPSGTYMSSLFERMGVADQIRPKLRQAPPGVRIGTLIVNGEADLGFQQVSELIHAPGIDYLGPLPPDLQNVTTFASAIPKGAPQAGEARSLVNFLSSPEAAVTIRKYGMEPG